VSWRTPLSGAAGIDQIDSCRFCRPGRATWGFIIHRKSGLFWSGLVKFGHEDILAYGSNCRRKSVAVAKRVIKESVPCSCEIRKLALKG